MLLGQKAMFSDHLHIPTSSYIKCADLLNLSLSYHLPILFIGPKSSGKSHLIRNGLLIESEKSKLRFLQYNISSSKPKNEVKY